MASQSWASVEYPYSINHRNTRSCSFVRRRYPHGAWHMRHEHRMRLTPGPLGGMLNIGLQIRFIAPEIEYPVILSNQRGVDWSRSPREQDAMRVVPPELVRRKTGRPLYRTLTRYAHAVFESKPLRTCCATQFDSLNPFKKAVNFGLFNNVPIVRFALQEEHRKDIVPNSQSAYIDLLPWWGRP